MFKYFRVKELRPHPQSVKARLPEVYTKYLKALNEPQEPVHYIPEPGRYKIHPLFQKKTRIENREIPLSFPKEADEGIWGGEGVIRGFTKEKKNRRKFPNYWIPKLKHTIVYSEVLNQYMKVVVTERTLKLIDENYGFDHYILKTPVQDLKSKLALSIRRKMLLALVNKEKYHEDEEKHKEVLSKYERYAIPKCDTHSFDFNPIQQAHWEESIKKEEAEWFGLTIREAIQKQRLLEEEQKNPVPLKHELRLKWIEELKRKKDAGEDDDEDEEEVKEKESTSSTSWLKRLNPFSKKSED